MLEGGLYPTLFAVGSMYIGIGSFAMQDQYKLGNEHGLDRHAVLHFFSSLLQFESPIPME